MKSIFKRSVSLATILMIIVSMLSTAFTATAAEVKVQIEDADGLGITTDITIGKDYVIHKRSSWSMIHAAGSKRAVYCLEPGKDVNSGDKFNENAAADFLKKVSNSTLNASEIQSLMGRVFLYGYTGNLDSVDAYYRYAATQLLVWEVIVGQRNMSFARVSNGYTSVETTLSKFSSDYAGKMVSQYYYGYETAIKNHVKAVSFAKPFEALAKASPVNAAADGTYTFTDKNNVLANFNAAVSNGSIVSKTSNSLKVKAESGKVAVVTLTQNNVSASGELTGFLTLTLNSKQTLAELKADPRKYYAAVKGADNGTLNIVKTSEDGIVANIAFTVTGNGKTYNVKTDSSGKISIPGLTAGEYTITETVPLRYEKQQSKKITVQAGKTVSVSFANMVKTGSIMINKQAEDGYNGGRTFVISGNGKNYTVTTADNGIATLTDLPVYDKNDNKITYTISEKDVPVKYVTPADQTATLTANEVTTKTFENKLKKFTAEVIKKDSETGYFQGSATLAGAVYGLYLDGELADKYITDESGKFKTKEYVCGNYTIQEIEASEGYLLDETVYPVGAEPEHYTVESNMVSIEVTEDVIKGRVSIIKQAANGVAQTEEPEAGAEFDVYIKSAGSYDNCGDSVRDHLVCDENGYAVTKLLPYGTYVIHQTNGWESTEWVDDFEVFISENEKTYTFVKNDPIKTSYVRIVKKDAESGNIIPVAGIGFKIWDNANSCYVMQKVDVPAEMDIDTFYTDETGTLMLPQELIYGSYELHEVQTAGGYCLGAENVPFTVDGSVKTVVVEKFNTAQKGKISVSKSGDTFSSVNVMDSEKDENGVTHENGRTTYYPVFSENNLSGAVYEVKAKEDIVTADGTVHAKAGDVVAELTTDEKGYAETGLLYLGKYEIREITAPYGYVVNKDIKSVELTYAGQDIEIRDTVNAKFVNDYQRVEISLEKVMENDEKFKIYGKDCFASVRFGLFAAEEITAADGNSIPADGFIAEVSIDENMKAVIAEKIPFGKYYVQEIATDEKYILNGEKYLVNFEYQGQEMTTVYIDCGTFKNELKRGKVEGIKCGEHDDPLANAIFGLFGSGCTEFTMDNALMTDTTDQDGRFDFDEIPFGSYIVHEIAAPKGYILSGKSYPVTISEDGQVVKIKADNEKIRGDVAVVKTDAEYSAVRLTGAEFTVFSDYNCNNKVGVLMEVEKGFYYLANLEYGDYFLKETAAPKGFAVNKKVYPFSIDGSEKVITIEMDNTPQKGRISVQKNGDIFESVTALASPVYTDENGEVHDDGYTVYSPVFREKGLAGAVYQVIAAEDIVTAGGVHKANAGDVIAELTTDENGYAETDLLYLGKYEVKEIRAPHGYVINNDIKSVELTYAGQEIEIRDTVNAAFVNDYQRVEISLEKVMEKDELFDIDGSADFKKIRFGLFAAENITAANGGYIPEAGLLSVIELTENMTAVISEKIPFGKYYVQELSTDDGYILSDKKYYVTFEYQGQDVSTVSIDCGKIENELKRGKVSGIKVNESEEPLENALFGLFAEEEKEFTEDNAVITVLSDTEGRFEFTDIPLGNYIVHEIKAPAGYILSDKSYPVTITENEETVLITAVNESIDIEISKVDVYGNELEGAQMQIVDAEGNVIDEWISDGTNHIVRALAEGRYILKEVAAPDGYIITTDITFNVYINGDITVEDAVSAAISEDGTPLIIMTDDTTKVHISKKDAATGDELPGAKLQVIDRDGNVIEEWTSEKEPHIIEAVLKAGESYVLREITAPEGYELAEDVEFTVNADGTVTEVVMKDNHTSVFSPPKTGGSKRNVIGWSMIGAALSIWTALRIYRRKKENSLRVRSNES